MSPLPRPQPDPPPTVSTEPSMGIPTPYLGKFKFPWEEAPHAYLQLQTSAGTRSPPSLTRSLESPRPSHSRATTKPPTTINTTTHSLARNQYPTQSSPLKATSRDVTTNTTSTNQDNLSHSLTHSHALHLLTSSKVIPNVSIPTIGSALCNWGRLKPSAVFGEAMLPEFER